ncbi:MAG: S8 family peptidase [Chloroflexi bacterium]|nr:S8 family peptidase [Chloroflexota bacterium]
MIRQSVRQPSAHPRLSINRVFNILLILGLLAGATPTMGTSLAETASKIQTALLRMAAEEPDQVVNIIVQKATKDKAAEALVTQLGGKVTKDLSIINAFAAEIPGKAVNDLGQIASVSWISLDAPVFKSASEDAVVLREDFDSTTWTDSGTWAGRAWQEIGETDGPDAGDVALTPFLGGTAQGVRLQNANKGIQSFANLAEAATATLTFTYRRKNWEDSSTAVVVEISPDNGATWVPLGRLTGPFTDADLQVASYDIAQYTTGNTAIRFVTSDSFPNSAKFYIDYVQIEYTSKPEQERGVATAPQKIFLPMISNGLSDTNLTATELDLPNVRPASVTALQSVVDWFYPGSFSENDGTENWASNWIENDPAPWGSGPNTGRVQLTGWSLRMTDSPDTGGQPSVARKVNLNGAATAKLNLQFSTSAGVDASDAVAVELSHDGGLTYTTIEMLTGITGATRQPRSYDISRFISANTMIRFRVAANYGGADEFFELHDVRIDYDRISSGLTWVTLAPDGSTWKYWDNGSNLGTAWRQPTFNDSSWHEGAGPLGYGDGDEVTVVGYGPNPNLKYPTTYFRRSFNVVNASNLAGANLWMLVNDGAVVYLNGVEVYRYNLPTGVINYNTYATTAIQDSWVSTNIPSSLLVNGENVLAVEIHQASANNADISFDLGIGGSTNCSDCINTANLGNSYVKSIGADRLWNSSPRVQGQGVTVAVVDSGIAPNRDILSNLQSNRVLKEVHFGSAQTSPDDSNGHGSHIAGIISGNGVTSNGAYIGVAPKANLLDVKVTDDLGRSTTSDVVAGLQWIYENKKAYNIRVVNLSLNSAVAESYQTSALDAALEVLWFNGIVVVVSAGNNGTTSNGILYPPANDPFVITIGAADDRGTAAITDDLIPVFSAFGTTSDDFAKPDLIAPGKNIVSLLASDDSNLILNHPSFAVTGSSGARYFRMSGTSMASAVAAGAVALLLQDEPNLTPDQVKYRLKATANKNWNGYTAQKAGAGYLDIYAAVNGTTLQSANTNLAASHLLWTGTNTITWGSVNWNSVNWNSVNWNSVNWNSVNWNSVNWNSVNWDN